MTETKHSPKVAMAIAAHPDDIEFVMSGTLMLLGKSGYELHYMNVANGSCGSVIAGPRETAAIRTAEAENAASLIGATFYEPLVNDLEILYTQELVARLCAVLRQAQPEILLVPSLTDYMEDHINTARIAVTAAFCRNMPNFPTHPAVAPTFQDMAVYHAMPMGLTDQTRNPVIPGEFVDVTGVMDDKRRMLACHKSQKEWLDESQGHDNYIHLMDDMCGKVGARSGAFTFAEGWIRHLHLGFGPEDFDPLRAALTKYVLDNGG